MFSNIQEERNKDEERPGVPLLFNAINVALALNLPQGFFHPSGACDRAPESGILEVNVGLGAKRYCISLKVRTSIYKSVIVARCYIIW
jgi:hypothetical protein